MHNTDFDIGDDCHGLAHIVEGAEQDISSLAIHIAQRVGKLVQELKGFFGKVDPDVTRIANVVKEVAQRVQAGFLFFKLAHIAHAQEGFKVSKGDCCWCVSSLSAT